MQTNVQLEQRPSKPQNQEKRQQIKARKSAGAYNHALFDFNETPFSDQPSINLNERIFNFLPVSVGSVSGMSQL